jgi:hypothetical protein
VSRESILAEVSAERTRQDTLFGGAAHDDTHSATDWIAIIVRHLGLATDDGSPAGICLINDGCAGADPVRYRRQLIRVAAIAVAALETFDRKTASASAEEHRARWQGAADSYGEPILVLPHRDPAMYGEGRSCSYATAESTATKWERDNAIARIKPTLLGAGSGPGQGVNCAQTRRTDQSKKLPESRER